jgi:hypothetical protein
MGFNIGKALGVKISPKGISLAAPKMTLTDAASIATMFASGGASGIGNIAKYSLGNVAKNMGINELMKGKITSQGLQGIAALTSMFGGGQENGQLGDSNSISGLIPGLMGFAEEDIQAARKDATAKRAMADQLRKILDPANIASENKAFEANTRGANNASAQIESGIARNLGMGGLASSIALNAENQTRDAAGTNRAQTHDPAQVANRVAAILATYDDDPEMIDRIIRALSGQQQLQAGQYDLNRQRPASLLETLMPSLTEIAGSNMSDNNASVLSSVAEKAGKALGGTTALNGMGQRLVDENNNALKARVGQTLMSNIGGFLK